MSFSSLPLFSCSLLLSSSLFLGLGWPSGVTRMEELVSFNIRWNSGAIDSSFCTFTTGCSLVPLLLVEAVRALSPWKRYGCKYFFLGTDKH